MTFFFLFLAAGRFFLSVGCSNTKRIKNQTKDNKKILIKKKKKKSTTHMERRC